MVVEEHEDLEVVLHSSLRPVLLVGKRSRVLRGLQHEGTAQAASTIAIDSCLRVASLVDDASSASPASILQTEFASWNDHKMVAALIVLRWNRGG